MDRTPLNGTWLLIDAAGPITIAGLVADGRWVAKQCGDGDFLEWFHPALEVLLRSTGRQLAELAGALYASGPGSTLGLRLAAMYLRTLLHLPALEHWGCLQYQNLELAAAAVDAKTAARGVVAPWRRDRWHRTRLVDQATAAFTNDWIDPEDAVQGGLLGVALGRRPPREPAGYNWIPYPMDRIPEVLTAVPGLLHPVNYPTPYLAEEPEFARWSRERHSGK